MAAEAPHAASIARLRDRGYVLMPQWLPTAALETLNRTAGEQLVARREPLELEADLRYPGAPASRSDVGGQTVRRLLDAHGRSPEFARWAEARSSRDWLREYFGESVVLSLAHHNCLMTKHPDHGSLTGWHRDIRYWSFERDDLVSIWLALGVEEIDNGALWFVPGSHRMTLGGDRFDESKFLLSEQADNRALLEAAESPRLSPGDAVFFHCNTLHSAGRNFSNFVKYSLVYTYHGSCNQPVAGSRSAARAGIALS